MNVLWTPQGARPRRCGASRERHDFASYDALWRWSVDDLEGFWGAVWDFFGVGARRTSGAQRARRCRARAWFAGARLNYAEHLLPGDADAVAVVARSQTRDPIELTFGELREQVARRPRRAAAARRRPAATASSPTCRTCPRRSSRSSRARASAPCGRAARPSSARAACSPGSRRSSRRCCSRSPATRYRDRAIDRRAEVAAIRAGLPTLEHVVHVPYGADAGLGWDELLPSRRARVRAGPVRPPALRAVLLRHHRPAEGDRARPRRDPRSSTTRRRGSAGTSSPAGGCCSSRRPPG